MRDTVVIGKLDHFGVDHDKLYILRSGFVEQADDNRIHANRLAGASRTGNQHMGHFCNIADDTAATDVFADSKGRFRLGFCEFGRINYLSQGNHGHSAVRNLDTDNRDLAGNRRNPDAGCTETERNIVGHGSQLVQTYTLIKLHFVAGNTGTAGHIDNMGVDLKAFQCFIQAAGVFPHLSCTVS